MEEGTVFDAKSPKDALRDREVVIYARVSSEGQEGGLPDQVAAVKDDLKRLGYRKSLRGRVFAEQASGTKLDRPALMEAMSLALDLAAQGKPTALVVRDIQRFSRDPYALGVLYSPLRDANVPVVALVEQLVLGTKSEPNANADLLAPILVAAGGTEVNLTKERSEKGKREARKKGISPGQPINVYPKEPLNPFREQQRLLAAGVGQKKGGQRLGRSGSWWRTSRDRMQKLREMKGEAAVEEWLSLTDKLREMEQEYGPRYGSGVKRRGMEAVSRVTSLYLTYPWEIERPSNEFLDEVFIDFKPYLKKDR